MLNWFNKKNSFIKFFFCIILLLTLLSLSKSSYAIIKEENKKTSIVYKNYIEDSETNYKIQVYYPKYNDLEIDAIIKDFIFDYIKDFKLHAKKIISFQKLNINYTLFYKEDYVNIFFDIENTLNKKDTSKNIIIDMKNKKKLKITDIYDEDFLKNNIINLVDTKYSSLVKEKVLQASINKYDYKISNKEIKIYLEDYDEYDYDLEVLIYLTELKKNMRNIDNDKKKVAITFDDGPSSEYTKEIVDTLVANEASATFFMLGYKMKSNEDIVKYVYENGMEIGSHTYSHKNLINLSKSKIENEINSVSILYNSITQDNIKYLRPPYGNYNNLVKEVCPYPIITWSIDPKDWLYRDETKVYNHIVKRVEDGSIILLHDVYSSTLETIKMLIPQLKSMGYEIVTISQLTDSKKLKLVDGQIYRKIN